MPVTYRIFPALRVGVLRFRETVSVEECAAALSACVQDKHYVSETDLLADLNQCTFNESSFRDILRLARLLERFYGRRSPAAHSVLWSANDVNFGIARMYQSTVDGRNPAQVGVFRTRSEGLDFIERDADTCRQIEAKLIEVEQEG